MPPDRQPPTARQATAARSLPPVVHRFIDTEASSGIVLLAATLAALLWANSPWQHGYASLWHTPVIVHIGPVHFDEDLRQFVNDGLMALFFLVVGLEIKRELVKGELANLRVAALPVFAALGGMLVPALVYLAIAGGTDVTKGWGIPMATDIAFALGVLAVVASRLPATVKLLLLTLAIVDDIGAIVVIALFYGGHVRLGPLLIAAAMLVVALVLRRLKVDWPPVYVTLGVVAWYATYRSGVHPTIIAVAFGLATSARSIAPAETARRWAEDLSDEPSAGEVRQMMVIARQSVSPAEHLEDALHPFTSFFVLPCFALANAGVVLHRGMLREHDAALVAVAVAVALVVGKTVGILAGSWIAIRTRVAVLPDGVGWRHLFGMALLGGIGFTVALFVTGLAFGAGPLADAAKVGILAGSAVAAVAGGLVLTVMGRRDAHTAV